VSSVSETAGGAAAARQSGGRSTGRVAAAAVLGIIAILCIIAAILYFSEPAHSLPSILGAIKSPKGRANEHRSVRGIGALVVGVVLLAGAWFSYAWKSKDRAV
jgi:Na+/H+ antiporter NhaD/arsenite permease-like protein